jgi:geranylgeranyl diphosphate synthase type II
MNLETYIASRKRMIDRALDKFIPPASAYPAEIHRAMRYSLFPGGKRFRPILVIASAEAAGGKARLALPTACAIELIHTYSLIHDDLPAIDNDDYRRGRPSTHRKFGEAIAILTGDALLTLSFALITRNAETQGISRSAVVRIIREVADAIGSSGMIGGQAVDIRRKKKYTGKEIEYIHAHKTGALIRVAVRTGAILAGATPAQLRNLTEYGKNIGLAFQIVDDAFDANKEKNAPNYAARFGKEASLEKVQDLVRKSTMKLTPFGKKGKILEQIAEGIALRFP